MPGTNLVRIQSGGDSDNCREDLFKFAAYNAATRAGLPEPQLTATLGGTGPGCAVITFGSCRYVVVVVGFY